jgi:hypothetical protein
MDPSTKRAAMRAVVAAMGLMMAGCDLSSPNERYVILETAPFVMTDVDYDPARIDAVIVAVRTFADGHDMDFLLASSRLDLESLEPQRTDHP